MTHHDRSSNLLLQKSNINNRTKVIYWLLQRQEDNPAVLDHDMIADQLSQKILFIYFLAAPLSF